MGPRRRINEKPQNPWQTLKKVLRYLNNMRLVILVTLIFTLFGTVIQVLSPVVMGQATTIIFTGIRGDSGIDFSQLLAVLIILVGLYCGEFLSQFLTSFFMTRLGQRISERLRNDLKEKINLLPIKYLDGRSTGDLMSVAMNDLDNISSMLQRGIIQSISSIVLVVGMIIMMLIISPLLTLIVLLLVPITILVAKVITPKTQENYKAYAGSLGLLNGEVEEKLSGYEVIRSFNNEENSIEKFSEINKKMYGAGWRSKFYGGIVMPMMQLSKNVIYVIVCIIGALHVAAGSLTIGNFQAFLQYSMRYSRPVAQLSQLWTYMLSMIASAERVFAILDAEEKKDYRSINLQIDNYIENEKSNYKIEFENVDFGYDDELLMKDFNLQVKDKSMVAIVGPTGAGKTTIVNLLERFYEINGGEIRIDGVNIENISDEMLHKSVGMVLQDSWLFSGTIFENIKYGNDLATDEDVYSAAKNARADDFIRKLPNGYDTVLNEETSNISVGQKQLITIARAFLQDPEILILDEATSSVDTRTEMLIQEAMRRLLEDRTTFVIAHRLSTIYNADKIIVMDKGNVVSEGTHEELLQEKGLYRQMYQSQFS